MDAANGINYVTNATYAPHGALARMKNGVTATFGGFTTTNTYNKRLQPVVLSAAAPTWTVFSLSYDFALNVANNGNVKYIRDDLNLYRSQNFTYDELNRVKEAWTDGAVWGNSYVYDVWGNLNKKQACATGSPCEGKPLGEWLDQSSDSNNRMVGFCYDAAGNLIRYAPCPGADMTYDAENRLVSVAGVGYTYNADGNRVKKSTGTAYWYGPGGEMLAESDAAGTMTDEYVYFNGRRVARRLASGEIHYYFANHLGSASVLTNASGTIVEESDYYPFGRERIVVNGDPNLYKFTGKERDVETGLYNFGARYYHETHGRFMSPDEFAGGPVDAFSSNDPLPDSPLPYADIINPQSLNKYTYTYNNPLRYTDPNGHDGWDFLLGATNAFGSNFFGGAGRIEGGNSDLQKGQALGDAASAIAGAAEVALGAGAEVGGLALDATGVGAVIGVPANVVGAAAIGQGLTAVGSGTYHLSKSASGNYEKTPENADLTGQGRAPVGVDGHKVELHHPNQSPKGPVKEMTRTDHRGKGNYNKNHPFGNRRPSQIDKAKAGKVREDYWKKQHDKEFKKEPKKR